MAIKGYTSSASINVGESVAVRVHAASPGPATYNVYRLGWYQGNGARKVASVSPTPRNQPNCLSDASTGLVDCGKCANNPNRDDRPEPLAEPQGESVRTVSGGAFETNRGRH